MSRAVVFIGKPFFQIGIKVDDRLWVDSDNDYPISNFIVQEISDEIINQIENTNFLYPDLVNEFDKTYPTFDGISYFEDEFENINTPEYVLYINKRESDLNSYLKNNINK